MRTALPAMLCATLFISFTTTSHAAALTGPITNPANGHAYYLIDTATWSESESVAITMGGHLVTINDQAENEWIYNTFSSLIPSTFSSSSIWIGLNDVSKEGEFVWTSGEPVSYLNWYPNQPDNYLGLEDYAHMLTPHSTANESLWGMWDDTTNEAGDPASSYGVVEVVPLPPVVWLFASGLIALIGLTRRRDGKI